MSSDTKGGTSQHRKSKRKALTIGEIKNKLTTFGMTMSGRKQELCIKLEKVEQISEVVQNKPINESWNLGELDLIISLLSQDEEWAAADVKYVFENLNQRTCAKEALTDANVCIVEKIKMFYRNKLEIMAKKKTDTVTADSLVDMMDKLAKKRPGKWGNKEADLLITRFSMVHAINATQSSYQAIEKYRTFVEQLLEYYSLHPDMKALIES